MNTSQMNFALISMAMYVFHVLLSFKPSFHSIQLTHGCHRTWKTWESVQVLKNSVNTGKVQGKMSKSIKCREKLGNDFQLVLAFH